jgi:hypothetical protein
MMTMRTTQADIRRESIAELQLHRRCRRHGPDESMIAQYSKDVECGKALLAHARMNG